MKAKAHTDQLCSGSSTSSRAGMNLSLIAPHLKACSRDCLCSSTQLNCLVVCLSEPSS
jgi:hypothetical protein